ncbi:MAG: hypothetical protein IJM79_03010 [Erysipelotrichaceae bacterium]|nr:hypothetical protein [Erysipelotrichaceae bacterium]
MPKHVMNYQSGEYEWIDENGYSLDQGCFVFNWDDSEYQREEEERRRRWEDDEEENDDEQEEHRRFFLWSMLFGADDDQ